MIMIIDDKIHIGITYKLHRPLPIHIYITNTSVSPLSSDQYASLRIKFKQTKYIVLTVETSSKCDIETVVLPIVTITQHEVSTLYHWTGNVRLNQLS